MKKAGLPDLRLLGKWCVRHIVVGDSPDMRWELSIKYNLTRADQNSIMNQKCAADLGM